MPRLKSEENMMRRLGIVLVGIFTLGSLAFAQRPDLPGSLVIDLGINSWSTPPTDISLNGFQSKTTNIIYYYDFPIGQNGFTFTPGIGLGLERYSFEDGKTLTTAIDNSNNRVVAVSDVTDVVPNGVAFDRSKLGLNYLDIPLEIRYYTSKNDFSRGFRAALGVKGGLLYSSFVKIKYDDAIQDRGVFRNKEDLGFNRFRYGINARIGFGGFSFFGYFELSDKFEFAPPGGIDTRTMTLGISLTGF